MDVSLSVEPRSGVPQLDVTDLAQGPWVSQHGPVQAGVGATDRQEGFTFINSSSLIYKKCGDLI